ncbi:[FeFe] hydrogenase H-cluster maturation GTPase HydF [Proteiniclasticum ruminis]|jgi:[FeFe] hydrogenase H-cluster maturation GTPase HydF|uniref:[FeFe] hydrogenase H-cluster maturation GTPase HydF n=1 Tax=Proteiniclasticum ruminis TaxID=398199 RepID=UPI001B444518|nr:[FeFe] hydrogenase H-cluster maturation GTPase HydF [Proteiniclasticum ruminis]MBP9921469.1 [FeFe] hydrogenase H-cluster maturation GTPase HydF [Proteiniclasticum sp.]
MGLHETPRGERIHIGLFGKTNAGKSSLMNAITGQHLAVVSEEKGTTTDPVLKSMELLPLGPVVLMDTPGLDDTSILGKERIKQTYRILEKTDCALVIYQPGEEDDLKLKELIKHLENKNVPFLKVMNKKDLLTETLKAQETFIPVSIYDESSIYALKEAIGTKLSLKKQEKYIIRDLLHPKDLVVLVVPVDSAAPKGRLILPQQMVLREILDYHGKIMVVQVEELEETMRQFQSHIRLVITDSQAFQEVKEMVPRDVALTSFSILMARYKGDLQKAVAGAGVLKDLPEGSRILISEGCSHHKQCDDIGTVKLPKWIEAYTGKEFEFHHTNGQEFDLDTKPCDLVIHCGGCMLSEREMKSRISSADSFEVPVTNYGILIAQMNGILERSIEFLRTPKG